MDKYIGFKLIQAEPMNHMDFYKEQFPHSIGGAQDAEGYKVVYPDGYTSWSPKEVFEAAYMKIGENCTITQENVESFIAKTEISTMGDKTTVVQATLVNGFIIVESSSCMDPENYNESIGAEICVQKIVDKVWNLLGFLLQTARYGIKR